MKIILLEKRVGGSNPTIEKIEDIIGLLRWDPNSNVVQELIFSDNGGTPISDSNLSVSNEFKPFYGAVTTALESENSSNVRQYLKRINIHPEDFKNTNYIPNIIYLMESASKYGDNLQGNWYYNRELLNRNPKEVDYVIRIARILDTPVLLKRYFKNIEGKGVENIYANPQKAGKQSRIKDAGIGSHDPKTIYGMIETWTNNEKLSTTGDLDIELYLVRGDKYNPLDELSTTNGGNTYSIEKTLKKNEAIRIYDYSTKSYLSNFNNSDRNYDSELGVYFIPEDGVYEFVVNTSKNSKPITVNKK